MEIAALFRMLVCVAVSNAIKLHSETLEWSKRADMPHARSDMTASFVDGAETVYLAGGCETDQPVNYLGDLDGVGLDSCEISDIFSSYKPESDDWVEHDPIPNKRYRHAAAVYDEKIYLIGGYTPTADGDELLEQIDVYDTTTDEWSTIDSIPITTSDAAAFTIDAEEAIYYVGGYDGNYNTLGTTYKYKPNDPEPMWEEVGDGMVFGRGDFGVAVVLREDDTQKAYSFGGYNYDVENDEWAALSVLEMFDPSTDTWTNVRTTMGEERGDKAAVGFDGHVVVLGGQQNSGTTDDDGNSIGTILDHVEAYDPSIDEWFEISKLPTPRFRFAAAAHDKTIYVFGGQGEAEGNDNDGYYLPVLKQVEWLEEPPLEDENNSASIFAQFLGLFLVVISCCLVF